MTLWVRHEMSNVKRVVMQEIPANSLAGMTVTRGLSLLTFDVHGDHQNQSGMLVNAMRVGAVCRAV